MAPPTAWRCWCRSSREVLERDRAGPRTDIGFWCSGSSDYLAGRAFSFVSAVDAIGAFPPMMESHVEMDGALALYEAWVKVLTGEADVALAYGFGKSSAGDLRRILALQLDPYLLAPLWPDSVAIAALQARLGLEQGLWTEKRRWPRSRSRSRAAARVEPARPGVRRGHRRRAARAALRGRPAAGARLRAGRRRRGGGDPRGRGAGAGAVQAAGLDHRVRAPDRLGSTRRAATSRPRRRRPRPGWRRARLASRSRSCTRPSRIRSSCCGPRSASTGSARISPSGRRAVRQPDVRGRPGPDRARGPAGHVRRGRPRTRARDQRPGPAAEPRLRDGGPMTAGSGKQRAAVLGAGQTQHRSKRPDVSIAGLCREAVDRALADAGLELARHRRCRGRARRPTCSRA